MEIKMTPSAFGEPSTIIGSCLNCTTPANLLATLAVIVIGMGLAVHFERHKRPSGRNGQPSDNLSIPVGTPNSGSPINRREAPAVSCKTAAISDLVH